MLARAGSLAAYRAIRPLLFRLDPEHIHGLTLRALARTGSTTAGRGLLSLAAGSPPPGSPVSLAGVTFRNRVGVGAGFDKDGRALAGWAGLGLGFAEVGTVTPEPQAGNPRPRLFRLPADDALVNRMGFNNAGAQALAARVAAARARLPEGFAVGVNIGRGRETPDDAAIDDYLAAFRAVSAAADYVAVNVSSPNTRGLRAMQSVETLTALLAALVAERAPLGLGVPLLVKLAPDLDDATVETLAEAGMTAGAAGLILGNTTTGRSGLLTPAPLRDQAGGLSGRPLLPRMLELVARVRARIGSGAVLVASGGIGSGRDAVAAMEAGADLVQLWTGLVYRGPGLIGEVIGAVR
jgi:dihydroorotate dehydrogenase